MMNQVCLVGRLTKEVNLRKTGTGKSVASFTVACNRRTANDGEQSADFINCVAWRQSADFLAQYATKGSLVGVEGRIQSRSYDDASGKRVYVTEVVAESVQLLESKKNQAQQGQQAPYGYNQQTYQQPQQQYQQQPQYNQPEPNYEFDGFGTGPTLDISPDDLPF